MQEGTGAIGRVTGAANVVMKRKITGGRVEVALSVAF
jgi:hypothetical protein